MDIHNHLPIISRILNKKPPTILFHYTTPIGMVGITQTKKIWATDIRFLNDKKEFHHSLETARSIIENFDKDKNDSSKLQVLESKFLGYIKNSIIRNWNPEVYVTSFTEKGDLLSQWRGYCPKGGFSMGFSSNLLSKVADNNDSFLFPCIYDTKQQKKILEELLSYYSQKYRDASKEGKKNSEDQLKNICNDFLIYLFLISPMLKHESFKEEKEWRIVSSNLKVAPDIHFRANDLNIIPYIELPLSQVGSEVEFKKIFIGPASKNQYSKEAVSQLLRKNRINKNAITFSSIPYRSV